jgi:predicted DNA binding CopG/RHH family protein
MYGCGSFYLQYKEISMNKKSNAGRKPIGDTSMDDRITFRLTDLEYQAIKITAEEHGYKDLSKFMRRLLVKEATIRHVLKQLKPASN